MNPVVRQLVRKDVRLNLPLMILMTGAGLLALLLMFTGRIGFAVGGIVFITANIAGGIFIGMFCIVQERKDQSSLFALSLPVTVREFGAVKLLAALMIFGVPWLLLTLASCTLTLLLQRVADGLVVYTLLVQGCILAITVAYFTIISINRSEAVAGFGILILNMCFSLFMVLVNQPWVKDPISTGRIVWPGYALLMLGTQVLLAVGSLVVAALVLSRRREYV
jgi:hypothetical protein